MGKSLEERVAALEEAVNGLRKRNTYFNNLGIGDTFKLAAVDWKILDITEQGYLCLAENVRDAKFGKNNNWKESNIREYLNSDFFEKLAKEIGTENIIPFKRNLLSMDGQTEYGDCEDKVSVINVDEYRKYRSLIPNAGYWWWTLTADSTPCNDDDTYILVVSPSGLIYYYVCNCSYGVRPLCIFSSSIFESEE